MKHFILVMLFMCGMFADAQKIRFTDTTNKWVLLEGTPDATSSQKLCHYTFDTLIAGRLYHVLSENTIWLNTIAVREDTISGKVYFRFISTILPQGTHSDTTENLLFDYNLRVGDTLKLSYWTYNWQHVVRSVDSIQLDAYYYKVWEMAPIMKSGPPYYFIEALGTTQGPTYNAYPQLFEGCYQLRCFYNHGINSPVNPSLSLGYGCFVSTGPLPVSNFDNRLSCDFKLDVQAPVSKLSPVLFPNPITATSILRLPARTGKCTLIVTDYSGKRLVKEVVVNAKDIPLGQYITSPGIFHFILQDDTRSNRYSGHFIKL